MTDFIDLDGEEPEALPTPSVAPRPSIPEEVIGQGAEAGPRHEPDSPDTGPALQDRAAEAHVLSCLLLDPQQATLPAECFYFPEHRLLYLSIRRLLAKEAPVELASIAADLADHGQFSIVGEWPFLFQIEARDQIPTTMHLRHYADRIAHLAEKRSRLAHAKATLEAIAEGRALPPVEAVFKRPDEAAAGPDEESRRITLASNPTEPTTRLFLAGKPVATPGNLVSIISKAKTGKTATIGSVVAAIVGAHYDRTDLDTFGFTAPHTKEAVVLIDTEQSPFDAFVCHQRAFARANQQEDVSWMMHYALVGYDADRLKATLLRIMAKAKAAHGAVFTLILDGVADFVKSVNDEAEGNDFISWLRALAVQYDCPIICVIHSNEAVKAGDDGRGHLGKQLTRKAESNLLLKKVGEVTIITSEKQRKAPITEADGIAFKWSSELGRHVTCENPDKPGKAGRKRTHDINTFWECIPKANEKPLTGSQLHKYAVQISEIKPQTFKDLLNEACETGLLSRTYDKAIGYSYNRAL